MAGIGKSEQRYLRLLEALKVGEEDIKAGRCKPFTPDLFTEIIENAKKKARVGRTPKRE